MESHQPGKKTTTTKNIYRPIRLTQVDTIHSGALIRSATTNILSLHSVN